MKNYPINNSEGLRVIGYYWSHSIPCFEWGEKIYVLINGTLRAIIPLAVAVANKNGGRDMYGYLVCKMAGETENKVLYVGYRYSEDISTIDGPYKFFKSQEDYFANLKGTNSEMKFPFIKIDSILNKDHGISVKSDCNGYHCANMWAFDDRTQKPELADAYIDEMWIDDEGSHIKTSMRGIRGGVLYRTPEECVAANTADVVDFDEDEPVQKDKAFWVDLPKKVAVVAKTEEEAKDRVKDALDRMLS